jgi:hypothetical protein
MEIIIYIMKIKSGTAAFSYISYSPGGISNLQISGSLSPWITWLYNQQSNKLFENTLLTTNVVTQEFIGTQFIHWPSNGSTPLSPQSQYLLDNSNLKIGDIISLENYNITWPNIASIQSTDPLPFDFPVEDFIYPEEVSTFKVENIVFPGPISASYEATEPITPGLWSPLLSTPDG